MDENKLSGIDLLIAAAEYLEAKEKQTEARISASTSPCHDVATVMNSKNMIGVNEEITNSSPENPISTTEQTPPLKWSNNCGCCELIIHFREILCKNPNCQLKFFHPLCVDEFETSDGKWYCFKCRKLYGDN